MLLASITHPPDLASPPLQGGWGVPLEDSPEPEANLEVEVLKRVPAASTSSLPAAAPPDPSRLCRDSGLAGDGPAAERG